MKCQQPYNRLVHILVADFSVAAGCFKKFSKRPTQIGKIKRKRKVSPQKLSIYVNATVIIQRRVRDPEGSMHPARAAPTPLPTILSPVVSFSMQFHPPILKAVFSV